MEKMCFSPFHYFHLYERNGSSVALEVQFWDGRQLNACLNIFGIISAKRCAIVAFKCQMSGKNSGKKSENRPILYPSPSCWKPLRDEQIGPFFCSAFRQKGCSFDVRDVSGLCGSWSTLKNLHSFSDGIFELSVLFTSLCTEAVETNQTCLYTCKRQTHYFSSLLLKLAKLSFFATKIFTNKNILTIFHVVGMHVFLFMMLNVLSKTKMLFPVDVDFWASEIEKKYPDFETATINKTLFTQYLIPINFGAKRLFPRWVLWSTDCYCPLGFLCIFLHNKMLKIISMAPVELYPTILHLKSPQHKMCHGVYCIHVILPLFLCVYFVDVYSPFPGDPCQVRRWSQCSFGMQHPLVVQEKQIRCCEVCLSAVCDKSFKSCSLSPLWVTYSISEAKRTRYIKQEN